VSRRGDGLTAGGAFVDADAEWRPSVGVRLRAGAGWDASRLAGRGSGSVSAVLGSGERTLSLGAVRSARADSFRALAGERVDGRTVGAASETSGQLAVTLGGPASRLRLGARAGEVTGSGFAAIFAAAASARADWSVLRRGAWSVWAGAAAEATHHARDLSGSGSTDPAAPRLFSPPLFVSASPRVSVEREGGSRTLTLDAGPALQVTAGPRGGARMGGDVRLSVAQRLADRLRLSLDARAEQVASVYARAEVLAGAAFLF
jgi:hypothetical protein